MEVYDGVLGQKFIKMIRQLPNPMLLDMGCGDGLRLFPLLDRHGTLHAVGVDTSLKSLRRALKRSDEKGIKDRVDFILGDANLMPIKDGAFNCGLVISVLYLIRSLSPIAELHRVTKGVVLIREKTFNPVTARAFYSVLNNRLVIYILGRLGSGGSFHGSYYLTASLLKKELLEAKFEIIRQKPIYYIPIPKNLFNIYPQSLSHFLLRILSRIEDCIKDIPILKKYIVGWTLLCYS